ncbi:MAG TPA: dihydrolipoamide acetyltransferase family protein [Sedimentisphaerales bacterium]|nr:dihydrolipoamide acetyltransferase family protein [Sedimentisphaerales bacterium]HRS11819.1 dihydrolipoamide acetyltransferase family protein [Sedimentisphaerales bacterium]HRV48772.1 dihydrolipoamide acetyltransferase family protein [Sedimentisphaerales bacterium]
MAKEIKLPQLGQTMEEGTVVNCLVKVGDEVKKGDVIFEIETDKATLEMESPFGGFVKHILAKVDQTLLVGAPMLILGEKDENVPQSYVDSLLGVKSAAGSTAAAPAAEPAKAVPEPARPAGKIMASPRAKKLAEELGVDLATLKGTGPAGKITEADIQKAAEAKAAQPAPAAKASAAPTATAGEARLGATIALNRLQRITAERMLKSKQEIPCFYLTVKADVTNLVARRAEINAAGDVKVSFNDFIMKAVATALEKFPIMTGQLVGNTIKLADAIHIGLAISVPDGLVAPLVKDVNKKGLKQIARDSQALVERARNDKLDLSDLEGGCTTVSNLGAFGIESFIPIVVPGQCTILGVGKITDTCVPDNGNILLRKLMNLTLSVDHKVANGAYAAQFLDFVRTQLEDPKGFAV